MNQKSEREREGVGELEREKGKEEKETKRNEMNMKVLTVLFNHVGVLEPRPPRLSLSMLFKL